MHVDPRPRPADPDMAWLIAQHDHDVAALDRAADRDIAKDAVIAGLRREVAILIHDRPT